MTEDIAISQGAAADSGCACCSSHGSAQAAEANPPASRDDVTTTAYGVVGMTCGHCVGAVTTELAAVEGVQSVVVDLVAGGQSVVEVTSAGPLDETAVSAAVDEAGYEFAGRVS
jgi:copper chaperone CopZ